jgi:hypothetical protein
MKPQLKSQFFFRLPGGQASPAVLGILLRIDSLS